MAGGTAFDVDVVVHDERVDPPWGRTHVHMLEIGGNRHFWFATGAAELRALNVELHRAATPRPLTHRAFAMVIDALGGKLDHIVIDKGSPSEQTYEAKLHISQANSHAIIDVRPSDAIILALARDVPILVSDQVVSRLSEEGRWGN
jgi:bifunctional DNase/RNase